VRRAGKDIPKVLKLLFLKWIIIFLGIALILIGVLSLAYHGIPYTIREQRIAIGPLEATQEVRKTIPLSPVLGGPILAAEIVLVVIGVKRPQERLWQTRDNCHEKFRRWPSVFSLMHRIFPSNLIPLCAGRANIESSNGRGQARRGCEDYSSEH
jgi:hypothetical protein